jgi:DNA-binding PadR family transcriptional regulator
LRKTLLLTDGNLGTHIRVLIDAGFVSTEEHWRGKRRTTLYQATSAGRAALDAHIRALNAIIAASGHLFRGQDRLQAAAVDHRDKTVGKSGQDGHDDVRDARRVQYRYDRERRARRHRDRDPRHR